jgi:hypothetical protein
MKHKDSFWIWGVGIGVLVIGAGAAVYYYQKEPELAAVVEPVAAIPEPVVTTPAPRPVPIVPPAQPAPPRAMPLPALDASDADVRGGLTEMFGEAIGKFIVPERIVRNAVVTLDNLPRAQMALQQRPIKPPPGEFIVSGPEGGRVLAPENHARYTEFTAQVKAVDAKTLVALYRGLQPLFQQAYEELGHPNALFNTRLLEVIDHLLATPTPSGEIRLVQPSVVYRYADERLEKLSSGQKLLIRMGPENAAIVKAKLREIQAELL